jgi:hypothetical protein
LRKQYKAIRMTNLRKSKVLYPTTISKRSIIVDYYLLGKRK